MPETKIAPTEAKSREQHEALVAANKKLIDETTSRVKAEGIDNVVNIKTVKRERRDGQTEVR
jgi:hypothetical protein